MKNSIDERTNIIDMVVNYHDRKSGGGGGCGYKSLHC